MTISVDGETDSCYIITIMVNMEIKKSLMQY